MFKSKPLYSFADSTRRRAVMVPCSQSAGGRARSHIFPVNGISRIRMTMVMMVMTVMMVVMVVMMMMPMTMMMVVVMMMKAKSAV